MDITALKKDFDAALGLQAVLIAGVAALLAANRDNPEVTTKFLEMCERQQAGALGTQLSEDYLRGLREGAEMLTGVLT